MKPAAEITLDSFWMRRALGAAPHQPMLALKILAKAFANPNATSDALLWIADALEEVAVDADIAGRPGQALEVRALADLPRQLAPLRARQNAKRQRVAGERDPGGAATAESLFGADTAVDTTGPKQRASFLRLLRGLPLGMRTRSAPPQTPTSSEGK